MIRRTPDAIDGESADAPVRPPPPERVPGTDETEIDEIGIDEIGIDEIGIDEIGIDEIGIDETRVAPSTAGSTAQLDPAVTSIPEEDESFRPRLETFAGPLDLLLYLIHRNEVDILDIPIAQILEQYLAHLRALDASGRLDLLAAGDFLVMAARLMEIKSRMLLPSADDPAEDELELEFEDPRQSLVAQLLEYKEIKTRALLLEEVYEQRSLRYERPPGDMPDPEPHTLDLSRTTLWDLAGALQRALEAAAARDRVAVIEVEDIPIEEIIHELHQRLGRAVDHTLLFSQVCHTDLGTRGIISTFLGVLEMTRLHVIRVEQSEEFGEIQLVLRERVAG